MKIHFIGIGGIGVSALARYYLAQGHQVTGSDLVSSEITDALKKLGAKIFIGKHKARNLSEDVDLVIYSPAISKENPELKRAFKIQNFPISSRIPDADFIGIGTKFKIQILSYPEALGELTKKYFTIAIAGSHGKSTVAAMIGIILAKAGFDPTIIVGTKLKEFAPHPKNGAGSNCRVGKSKYLVIEADEHFASFLNYWPKIIVLTNLEPDHLDYFKNFKNYILTFKKFISHLPKSGILVANKDDRNISKLKTQNSKPQLKTQNYSLKQREAEKLRRIMKIPGEFNVSNALAALTVSRALEIPDKISFKTLSEYRGSWRRFEIKKLTTYNLQLTTISDYAHHPTQVRETLKATREKFPKKEIWCIFQPHQYQRTYYLWKEFIKVFKQAPVDKLIITDIYDVAGRETSETKKKVSSQKLAAAICRCRTSTITIYLPKDEVIDYLKKNLRGGEVVIIMGAGDIYDLSKELKKWQKT